MNVILALDPSLSSTGYALINADNKKLISEGRITTTNKLSTDARIQVIVQSIIDICYKFINIETAISAVVLEDGFIGANKKGSQKLSELRGAIIFYFMYRHLKVFHSQPTEIRKNLGLSGSASKEEVANKVLEIYPELDKQIGPYSDKANKQKTSDIYDAISIGLSYLNILKEGDHGEG